MLSAHCSMSIYEGFRSPQPRQYSYSIKVGWDDHHDPPPKMLTLLTAALGFVFFHDVLSCIRIQRGVTEYKFIKSTILSLVLFDWPVDSSWHLSWRCQEGGTHTITNTAKPPLSNNGASFIAYHCKAYSKRKPVKPCVLVDLSALSASCSLASTLSGFRHGTRRWQTLLHKLFLFRASNLRTKKAWQAQGGIGELQVLLVKFAWKYIPTRPSICLG